MWIYFNFFSFFFFFTFFLFFVGLKANNGLDAPASTRQGRHGSSPRFVEGCDALAKSDQARATRPFLAQGGDVPALVGPKSKEKKRKSKEKEKNLKILLKMYTSVPAMYVSHVT